VDAGGGDFGGVGGAVGEPRPALGGGRHAGSKIKESGTGASGRFRGGLEKDASLRTSRHPQSCQQPQGVLNQRLPCTLRGEAPLRRYLLAFSFLAGIFAVTPLQGALIPPFFLSAVVAIGTHQPQQAPGIASERWFTEGTGFFYGYLVHDDKDPAKKQYAVFLVTAGHVIKEHPESCRQTNAEERIKCQSTIFIRLDAAKAPGAAREFGIPISEWFYHQNPAVDLAAMPIPIKFLRDNDLQSAFFASDDSAATRAKLEDIGASVGDGIFILGFPMNLAGEQKNYVIARQGAIARISEMFEGASPTFLVDSFVFPGNSGGPVINKPEVVAIQGTKASQSAFLIGVVISYQPYDDVAVSLQTKQPRVVFEENSGLANILPIDKVNEMLSDRAKAIWDKESALATPTPAVVPKPIANPTPTPNTTPQ
jgi:S1-C subfamily serine protease